MKEFGELIGKIVTVYPDEYESFKAKVMYFEVEDSYFYQKNEVINIYVHVQPINITDVDDEIEQCRFFPRI